jgi:hypothetical protein
VAEEQQPKRKGRPPKPGDRTRGGLTVRLRDDVRDKLEEAVTYSGRSLSEEIEFRLETSLNEHSVLAEQWGDDVVRLADTLARVIYHLEYLSGRSWLNDDETYADLLATIPIILGKYREITREQTAVKGNYAEMSREERAAMLVAIGAIPSPAAPVPLVGRITVAERAERERVRKSAKDTMLRFLDEEARNKGKPPE